MDTYKIIFDADTEEPDCCRCDNCCKNDQACEKCGPEYGWYHYERTEYIDLETFNKEG